MRRLVVLLAACCAPLAQAAGDASLMQRGEEQVMGTCFLCHGVTGNSSGKLYPELAGQNEAYLLEQLRHFKAGARDSSDMRKVVADMSDDDMRAAAHFFSRQPPGRDNPASGDRRALNESTPRL
ncbi:cytochrome c [Dechloromonas sp. XY25]|uniref:Cytochrome c n=1 Tax=Dechloromonas hankyongensis TaxID=2908002 RepID=A0ABS9K732_9RHOO|nr:cytochrome c [Dechloromonas hankyongensis]MCG2578974.1 cytochrome c [Dechloromonas hankyongensis]